MNIPCEQVGPTTVLPERQCGSSEVIIGETEKTLNEHSLRTSRCQLQCYQNVSVDRLK